MIEMISVMTDCTNQVAHYDKEPLVAPALEAVPSHMTVARSHVS